MITIKELTFWYSAKSRIFEHINLDLDTGHIYGLLGKNGAGKTTLLKLLCGLSFPKTGSIFIDGQDPAMRQPGFLSNIFLVPEEISLPSLSISKFAKIYGDFYPGFDPAMFRELLIKFELDNSQDLSGLSHGQKKKALIAFGMSCNTRYLFLDEPTTGLDIPSKAVLRTIIASSFSEERTIIVSTHQVRDQSLIDSVIIVENHRIVLNQSLDHIAEKLTFGHALLSPVRGDLLYSVNSELGQTQVALNQSGIPGEVDIESLFNAALNIPDKITSIFENQTARP